MRDHRTVVAQLRALAASTSYPEEAEAATKRADELEAQYVPPPPPVTQATVTVVRLANGVAQVTVTFG